MYLASFLAYNGLKYLTSLNMPVTIRDLPVKYLRELFRAYHDHTSTDRKTSRERLIRRVGEKNVAETSFTAFELTVAAPAALRSLGFENYKSGLFKSSIIIWRILNSISRHCDCGEPTR